MKYILLIFILVFTDFVFGQGDAPPLLQGQYQTSKAVGANIQAPNSSITKISSSTALIETGNKNILANASFEAPIVDNVIPSWFLADSLKTNETSIVIDGRRSLKANFTGDPLLLIQDSTTYASQFADGVQGIAMIRIKTSVAGLRVCPRSGGVTLTSICVSVVNNNKWGLYKVPFILGGTSNGISVNSNSVAVSGDFYFDDAFVGAMDIAATVDTSKVIFAGQISGANINLGSSAISTFTIPSNASLSLSSDIGTGKISCSGAVSNGSTCSSTNEQTGVVIDGLDNGTYEACYDFTHYFGPSLSQSAEFSAYFKVILTSDGSDTILSQGQGTTGSGLVGTVADIRTNHMNPAMVCGIFNVSSGSRKFALSYTQRNALTLAENAILADNLASRTIGVTVKKFSSSATYSSNNADTDWAPCQFSTLAWQGLGTVTNNLECKRQGSDLLIRGVITTGAVSASIGQVPLPLWNGTQLSTSKSQTAGRLARGNSTVNVGKDFNAILTAGFNYFTIGVVEYAAAQSPFSSLNGNALFSSSEFVVFENLRIPIQGWENSNIIIGQFNGLESCQDSYTCTDTFSAKISSSGVVSDENLDFISGNCSVSGSSIYTCTLLSGLRGGGQNLTSGMNCAVSPNADGVGTQFVSVNGSTSTTLTFATVFNSATGNRPFSIVCQKAGADYIAKSAKAVASDQNLRTPGVTNGQILSADLSTSCAISNQSGGPWISSSSLTATGICTSTFTTAFSQVRCWCNSDQPVNTARYCQVKSGSNNTQVITQGIGASSPESHPVTVFCFGWR